MSTENLANYTIDFDNIKGEEQLPELVLTWTEQFGQVSRQNEFPAVLAYFTVLGQLMKDFVRIPYGYTTEDTRVHTCWIQNARSGKSVLNDFLSEIVTLTWDKLKMKYATDFITFDCVDFTDTALVSSYVEIKNPDRNEEGETEMMWKEIKGHIEGSGMLLFDEFESSGIFKKMANKDSMVTYFQRLMNTMTTDGYLIKRTLTGKPIATTDCQMSVWATSYMPEQVHQTIAEKGVLQRMFLYVRIVPQDVLNEMRRTLITSIGTIKKRNLPTERFANAFVTMYDITKERFDTLESTFEERMADVPEADRYNCPQEEMMIWGDGIKELAQLEYDNMIKYLTGVPPNIRNIIGLFETNSLLYITKMAVLIAITETPSREDNQKWVVTARNVRQASWIVRQGYMSLTGWMLTAIKAKQSSLGENAHLVDVVNGYYNMPDSSKVDGWVSKTALKVFLHENDIIKHANFHRKWGLVEHRFEVKTEGRRKLVKLKEDSK